MELIRLSYRAASIRKCKDKLSNRYGGKGITASVRPDALMPRTKSGEVVEVILNMCGVN